MGRRYHYNPGQGDLFADTVNREILPIVVKEVPKNKSLPPGIALAIANIRKHLDELSTPEVSAPEPPHDGH